MAEDDCFHYCNDEMQDAINRHPITGKAKRTVCVQERGSKSHLMNAPLSLAPTRSEIERGPKEQERQRSQARRVLLREAAGPYPQPNGRPPKDHEWDKERGVWIDTNGYDRPEATHAISGVCSTAERVPGTGTSSQTQVGTIRVTPALVES